MADISWIGVALGPTAGVGSPAHLDARILAALDASGLDTDLVCTHFDHTGPVAIVTMSARVRGAVTAPALDMLARALDGTALAVGPTGEHTVNHAGAALVEAARQALRAARDGLAGRCARFPGQASFTGRHPAARIVADSAIDRVVGIGVPVAEAAVIDTRGFLRPIFDQRHLTLLVEPAAGGVFRPIEMEHPHECCGGH